MSDLRLEIKAAPRTIASQRDLDTPLFALAWQATRRWSDEMRQLKQARQDAVQGENKAWITLADEWFRLQNVSARLAPALEQDGLGQGARDLALVARRMEQALNLHDVRVIAPLDSPYTPDLAEVLESVDQVPQAGLQEPLVQQVLLPIIEREGRVIRLGKAIVAVPAQTP